MRNELRVILVLLCLFLITLSYPELKIEKERIFQYKKHVVPRTALLKYLAVEYDEAVADYFWMKVTLSYGRKDWRKIATDEDWLYLLKLTDLVTDLNPYFFIPYYFAGVVFPWESKFKKEVIPLLEKGMRNLPDEWRIPFLIGFIYFYYLHNSKRAAYYISLASEKEGSPEYLVKLAARLYYEAGEEENAVCFLREIIKSVKNPELKEELKRRIKALEDIVFLNRAVKKYIKIKGKEPETLEDLVRSGIISRIPKEPYGGKYYYDRKKKKVRTTSNLRLKSDEKGI